MTTERRILVVALGLVVAGVAAEEHLSRRVMERRYHRAVEDRQQLERQFSGVLTTHERLTGELAKERQRTQELAKAFEEKSAQLDKAVERLSQESQTIRELQLRLAAMTQQMNQLQGELAATLQDTGPGTIQAKSSAVQLDRIVVSRVGVQPLQGRVVSVHRDWDFVVIDLGWDTVRVGDTVSIFRNDKLLAKARVERVQEGVSAATLLPEWAAAEIHVNDHVQIL